MINILTGNAFSWNEIIYISIGAIFALVGSFSAQYLFEWINKVINKKNAGKQVNIEIHTSVGKDINGTPLMNHNFSKLIIVNHSDFTLNEYKFKIVKNDEFINNKEQKFFRNILSCETNSYILPNKDFIGVDTMWNVRNTNIKYFEKTELIEYEIYNKNNKLIKTDYIKFIDK